MDKKVKEFIEKCQNCKTNVDKKTIVAIKRHEVQKKIKIKKNWETVAADLFDSMPPSNM